MNLMEKAKQAIDKVFSDTSVSVDETKDRLQELIEELQIKLESLNA